MSMFSLFHSEGCFYLFLSLFLFGAFGSLLFNKDDHKANLFSATIAIIASVCGIGLSASIFQLGTIQTETVSLSLPLLQIAFHLDLLSAFFIFTISLCAFFVSIYSIDYIKEFYQQYNIGTAGFFYHLFLLGMIGVVSSSHALLFLIFWEVMSFASFFLVIYSYKKEENLRAGFLYMVMTHIGTACILLAFLLLYRVSGSFLFSDLQQSAGLLSPIMQGIVFLLFFIGFGVKAGIIPLHIWLPFAHPAAPSHVSALMSGVMIKTAIYMMMRLFLDILAPLPLWCGLTLLLIASLSSILGVLYALTEHDLKRLLAYHSIENIGIILLGLGASVSFVALGMPALASLGLVAALFHTLNHASFKSLLFLSTGAVVQATGTKNIESYGGLIKLMPLTALCFLIASMAISALPPLNGFFSEWMTFQVLFQGVGSEDPFIKWAFILATGSLAVTGGLALACFVKAFSITFLARPRTDAAMNAKEAESYSLIGMGGIASLCILLGIASGGIGSLIHGVVQQSFPLLQSGHPFLQSSITGLQTGDGFASVSGLTLLIVLSFALLFSFLLGRYLGNREQRVTTGRTWDCGSNLTPRMEITATGFARSIVQIFSGVLRPSLQQDVEYHDAESRYLKNHSRTVHLSIQDVYNTFLYAPVSKVLKQVSLFSGRVQGGVINSYLLYIFLALLSVLLFAM